MQVVVIDREHGIYDAHVHVSGCSDRTRPAYAYDQSSWTIPYEVNSRADLTSLFGPTNFKFFDCVPEDTVSDIEYSPMEEDSLDIEVNEPVEVTDDEHPDFHDFEDNGPIEYVKMVPVPEKDDSIMDFSENESEDTGHSVVFEASRHVGNLFLDFTLTTLNLPENLGDEASVILTEAVNGAAEKFRKLLA